MKISGIILVLIGILLIGYSLTLDPYTNEVEYQSDYFALDGANRSLEFYKLRTTYLTGKYDFENYGLTAMITGTFILILMSNGWKAFRIPENKITIVLVGLAAVLFTVGGYVGDLCLEMYRGSYPHWSDSIGIPLAVTPAIFILFFVWYLLHLIGLIGPFKTGGFVFNLKIKSINYWYAFVLLVTTILTLYFICIGDFWWSAAGLLWAYFYLSLLIGRRDGIIQKEDTETIVT